MCADYFNFLIPYMLFSEEDRSEPACEKCSSNVNEILYRAGEKQIKPLFYPCSAFPTYLVSNLRHLDPQVLNLHK